MDDKEKIKRMEKTLRYAYKDLNTLLKMNHNTNAETLITRCYSSINSGELESVANTLADIRDLIGRIE